ncbi:MAG TPA: hypothetical protein VJY41_03135 [Prolixibacteraceae bacterium]|nr:hypothetical protein [Prolixibacteraceae bacterium]
MIHQKIKNLFNKESDFEIGYEVAKQEFTSYYKDISINMGDDLFNFRAELVEDYGEDYAKKTEAFIEKSVILAEDMPPYIIADPTQAALMKKHQPTDFRIIHFLKMMTDIYSCWEEPSKIGIAKAYCKFGILLLDENEPHYKTYSKLFEGYKKTIMEREWNRD